MKIRLCAALCLLTILSLSNGCVGPTVRWWANDPPMTNTPTWAVEQK